MDSLDNKLKIFLENIQNKNYINKTLPEKFEGTDLLEIARIAESEGFIMKATSTRDNLIILFSGGGWMLAPSTHLTRAGYQFLEGYDRNVNQVNQNVTVNGNVSNSVLGNNSSQINYSLEAVIENLENYLVTNINDEDDLETGKNLAQTLENEEIKPGYLNKFENFLEEYPETAKLVSSILLGIVMGAQ